jgi:hypothetical protein
MRSEGQVVTVWNNKYILPESGKVKQFWQNISCLYFAKTIIFMPLLAKNRIR